MEKQVYDDGSDGEEGLAAVGAADPGKPMPALYAIAVSISWPEGLRSRIVTLQTQRAGTAPPPPP